MTKQQGLPNSVTLEHLDNKFILSRGSYKNKKRTVAACHKCNSNLGVKYAMEMNSQDTVKRAFLDSLSDNKEYCRDNHRRFFSTKRIEYFYRVGQTFTIIGRNYFMQKRDKTDIYVIQFDDGEIISDVYGWEVCKLKVESL